MKLIKYNLVIVLLLWFTTVYSQILISDKILSFDECLAKAKEFEDIKDYENAIKYLNKAAFYKWDKKEYDKTIYLFNHLIKINQIINDTEAIINTKLNLGLLYNDKEDYHNSIIIFQNVLNLQIKQNKVNDIIKTHIYIAAIFDNLYYFDESINHLNEALKVAIDINNTGEIRECYILLSKSYNKKKKHLTPFKHLTTNKNNNNLHNGDNQLAFIRKQLHEKQCKLKKADIKNKELEQQIASANAKLQSLEKEEIINEFKTQKIINKLKQEQQIKLFVITIVIVLLIFLLILNITLIRIKRLNKLFTERNEEVLRQKQSLEDENKIRTKLLSILSHDLRTPLSAVYLFLQILRSKTLSPKMQDKHLSQLEASLNSSFQMLDNMLYWAKNQINGIIFNPEVFDVNDAVISNLEFLNTNIQNKSIKIINNIKTVIYIYADKEMVNIILRNLISNAVKFTPKEGTITISCKKQKAYAIISIQDTGIGISKEKQNTIFTSHVISETGTSKETGTGLGLILVRDFINICKGKISFESAESKGTTFYVSLPLANLDQLKQKAK